MAEEHRELVRGEPELWHGAMLPAFGAMFYLSGFALALRKVRMEDHSAARVRRAAERGSVIYVMHTRSHVDWLALNEALNQRRLPLPVYTDGVDHTVWLPLAEMARGIFDRFRRGRLSQPSSWLAGTIASGRPVCLFLSQGQTLADLAAEMSGQRVAPSDQLDAVIRAQQLSGRPVLLVPVVVVWNRSPEPVRREVERFVLGSQDDRGALGKLWDLANASDGGLVQVGEPVEVSEFLTRTAEESPERQRKMLRLLLRRYLHREAQVVRGPRLRSWRYLRRLVLQSREVGEMVRSESARSGRSQERIARDAAKIFDRMAARFSFPWVRLARAILLPVFHRVFSGIDIRPEDLDRLREALRRGTPVLMPCHRSHLDYLLISVLLYEHDIVIPHVVAGDNLSFWPLGAIFRRGGAFFIRRSFSGDRVFPVIFERYVRELMRMEVPVEFYIEGGRSRTGKLLPPKLGVFGMVANAAAEARPDREVSFLPIHLAYEQIAEERVFARELSGAPKEKESVGGVMRATGVLRHRYGRVIVRVGEPILGSSLTHGWATTPEAERRSRLKVTALRLMQRIQRIGPALPTAITAAAALSHGRRGIRHEDLHARFWRFLGHLDRMEVPRSGGLGVPDAALEEAIARFVARRLLEPVGEGAHRVFGVPPARRVSLEYYKNSILHAFSGVSLYASAVRGLGDDRVDPEAARRLFRFQLGLLRAELLPDPDTSEEQAEERAITGLCAYGALRYEEGRLQVQSRALVAELANLTANLLESYALVLRAAEGTRGRLYTAAELPKAALTLGRTLLTVEEIVRAEALSLQNVQHAIKVFGEDGVWTARADGRLELIPARVEGLRRDLQILAGDGPAAR